VFRGDSENTESQEGRYKSPPGRTCAYNLVREMLATGSFYL